MAVRQAGVANQDASLHAVTGAGWALTRMTGPRKIHNAASVESTPPRIIVWTTPTVVPRIPPRTPPRGNVPQTMVRMVAFIRPCTRSGSCAGPDECDHAHHRLGDISPGGRPWWNPGNSVRRRPDDYSRGRALHAGGCVDLPRPGLLT